MTAKDANFWKGTSCCLLAALAWAIIGPASRFCFEAGMTPISVAFWRMLLASLCFLVHAFVRHELNIRRRDLAIMLIFGVVAGTPLMVTLQVSIQKSGGALAIILMSTAPAWVALFSRVLFQEHLTPAKLSAMAMAMLGTTLVCLSGGSLGRGAEVSWLGLVCGLLSGFFYALQFPFFVWWKDRYSTATLFALTFTPAAATLAFLAGPLPLGNLRGMGAILALGIVSSYVAYSLYGLALRHISQVQAAIMGNLEPVAGTLLSWWLWNENFSAIGWAGCVFVIGAMLLLTLRR